MKPEAPPPIGPILLVSTGTCEIGIAGAAGTDDVVVDLGAGLPAKRPPRLWIRISPLLACRAERELDRAMAATPAGLLLPGVSSTAEIEQLGAKLAVREAELGLPDGSIRILAVLGDNPAGILALDRLGGRRWPRLAGLVSDPTVLARALGCAPTSPTITAAEAHLVIAAAAVGVVSVQVLPTHASLPSAHLPSPLRGGPSRSEAEDRGGGPSVVRNRMDPHPARPSAESALPARGRVGEADDTEQSAQRAWAAGFGAILVEGSADQTRVGRPIENRVSGVATK